VNCIKCGKQIPEGELFCIECSLNPLDLTFDEPRQSAPRYPAPKGRMQTPQPVKRPAPQPVGPQRPPAKGGKSSKTGKKSGGNGGLKAALAIVSVLLAASLGFLLALLLMSGIRERLDTVRVPNALKGTPIALIMAGLMSLAFMGFKGMG